MMSRIGGGGSSQAARATGAPNAIIHANWTAKPNRRREEMASSNGNPLASGLSGEIIPLTGTFPPSEPERRGGDLSPVDEPGSASQKPEGARDPEGARSNVRAIRIQVLACRKSTSPAGPPEDQSTSHYQTFLGHPVARQNQFGQRPDVFTPRCFHPMSCISSCSGLTGPLLSTACPRDRPRP